MVAPFIVIRTFAIKEGKLEGFKHFLREFFRIIEAKEPRLLSLNAYLNKRGYRGNFRPRSPGRGFNEGAREPGPRAHGAGSPGVLGCNDEPAGLRWDVILEKTRQLAGAGIPLTVKTEHLGGFTRSAAQG